MRRLGGVVAIGIACCAIAGGCARTAPPTATAPPSQQTVNSCIGSYTQAGGVLTVQVVATGPGTLSLTSVTADGAPGPHVEGLAISPSVPVRRSLGPAEGTVTEVVGHLSSRGDTERCVLSRTP